MSYVAKGKPYLNVPITQVTRGIIKPTKEHVHRGGVGNGGYVGVHNVKAKFVKFCSHNTIQKKVLYKSKRPILIFWLYATFSTTKGNVFLTSLNMLKNRKWIIAAASYWLWLKKWSHEHNFLTMGKTTLNKG